MPCYFLRSNSPTTWFLREHLSTVAISYFTLTDKGVVKNLKFIWKCEPVYAIWNIKNNLRNARTILKGYFSQNANLEITAHILSVFPFQIYFIKFDWVLLSITPDLWEKETMNFPVTLVDNRVRSLARHNCNDVGYRACAFGREQN